MYGITGGVAAVAAIAAIALALSSGGAVQQQSINTKFSSGDPDSAESASRAPKRHRRVSAAVFTAAYLPRWSTSRCWLRCFRS
jgi:hypothetical protein